MARAWTVSRPRIGLAASRSAMKAVGLCTSGKDLFWIRSPSNCDIGAGSKILLRAPRQQKKTMRGKRLVTLILTISQQYATKSWATLLQKIFPWRTVRTVSCGDYCDCLRLLRYCHGQRELPIVDICRVAATDRQGRAVSGMAAKIFRNGSVCRLSFGKKSTRIYYTIASHVLRWLIREPGRGNGRTWSTGQTHRQQE